MVSLSRYISLMLIFLSGSLFAVTLDTGLTKDEEGELTIDESVSLAESKRLSLLLEVIKINLRLDRIDDASRDYRKTVEAYSDCGTLVTANLTETGRLLTEAYLEKGESDGALETAKTLLKVGGEDSITYHLMALALDSKGKKEEAAEWTQKALEYQGDNPRYRIEVGEYFLNTRHYEIAEMEAERAQGLSEKNLDSQIGATFLFALIRSGQGKYDEALENYKKAGDFVLANNLQAVNQEVLRYVVGGYISMAREYELQGDYEKEVQTLRDALKYRTLQFELNRAIASSLARQGKNDEAKELFEKTIKDYGPTADILVNYGDVLADLGKDEEAKKQYDEALREYESTISESKDNEKVAMGLNNLAWFYATHDRDLKKGIELSKRSLNLQPREPTYMDTLAELYFRSGDKKQAIETIKKAIELKPAHPSYFQQQLERFEGKTKSDKK